MASHKALVILSILLLSSFGLAQPISREKKSNNSLNVVSNLTDVLKFNPNDKLLFRHFATYTNYYRIGFFLGNIEISYKFKIIIDCLKYH